MGPFDTALLVAVVGLATPILFAALGELVSQRTGVINIGLEGMMLNGAFFSFWAAHASHSLLLGVLMGLAAGAAFGAIMAALTVSAGGDQIVVGVGINILAAGVTTFANQQLFSSGGNQPTINPMNPAAIPGIVHIPVIGKAFFDQVPLAYVAFLLVPVVWYVVYRTNLGLVIRGAGEYPDAVETSGVSVKRVRWFGALCAGGMAGIGGAMLTVANLGLFNDGMSGGRGFIALAAVIFGRWRPLPVLGACLVFGGADALQLRLQAENSIPRQVWIVLMLIPIVVMAYIVLRGRAGRLVRADGIVGGSVFLAGLVLTVIAPHWSVPSQFWLMLPYVITLVVLAGIVGRTRLPAALGLPYRSAATSSTG
jgi:simple sugar transport system permease protein